MKIEIERGILHPHGAPPPVQIMGEAAEGLTRVILSGDGMRVSLLLTPEESVGLGVNLVGTAHVVNFARNMAAAPPGVVGPDGAPVMPSPAPAPVTPIDAGKKKARH